MIDEGGILVWKIAIKSSKLKPGKKNADIGKKMILVLDLKKVMSTMLEAMRWPLAYGGKVKDDCITCPLHQTTHNIETGELIEWSYHPISLNLKTTKQQGKWLVNSANRRIWKIYETLES